MKIFYRAAISSLVWSSVSGLLTFIGIASSWTPWKVEDGGKITGTEAWGICLAGGVLAVLVSFPIIFAILYYGMRNKQKTEPSGSPNLASLGG